MKYVNFCLAAIISLMLMSGTTKNDKPSIGYFPGEQIPNIVLQDVSGKTFDLSRYKGKTVVLNFWAAYDAHFPSKKRIVEQLFEIRKSGCCFPVGFLR